MKVVLIFLQLGSNIPEIILAYLAIYHLIHHLIVDPTEMWKKLFHPWFILCFFMSSFLFLIHLSVAIVIHWNFYEKFGLRAKSSFLKRLPNHLKTFKKMEFLISLVDINWAILWLLQLTVQYLLTPRHRLYPIKVIKTLSCLYLLHLFFAIPLTVIIFGEFEKVSINKRKIPLKNGKIYPPSSLGTMVRK